MNIGGPRVGLCRRNPPTLVVVGVDQMTGGVRAQGNWSPSSSIEWCGQHEYGQQRYAAKPADPVDERKSKLKLL